MRWDYPFSPQTEFKQNRSAICGCGVTFPVLGDFPGSPIDTYVVPGQLKVHFVLPHVTPRVGAPLDQSGLEPTRELHHLCVSGFLPLSNPHGYYSRAKEPHV